MDDEWTQTKLQELANSIAATLKDKDESMDLDNEDAGCRDKVLVCVCCMYCVCAV